MRRHRRATLTGDTMKEDVGVVARAHMPENRLEQRLHVVGVAPSETK